MFQSNANQTEDSLVRYERLVHLKDIFQLRKVEGMEVTRYEQFENCRSTTLMSKGKNTFKSLCNVDSKQMETLAFVLKFILKSAIELAILNENGEFGLLDKPLKVDDYKSAFNRIRANIDNRIEVY